MSMREIGENGLHMCVPSGFNNTSKSFTLSGMTVMSSFVRKILIDNGCNIPISITNLGIDHITSSFDKKINLDLGE